MMKVRHMQNGLHGCGLTLLASPTLPARSDVSYPEAHSGSFPEPEPCWERPVVWSHFCRPTGPRGSLGCLAARLGHTLTHTNTNTHTGRGGVAHKNHDMDESRSVMTEKIYRCAKKKKHISGSIRMRWGWRRCTDASSKPGEAKKKTGRVNTKTK